MGPTSCPEIWVGDMDKICYDLVDDNGHVYIAQQDICNYSKLFR